MVFIRARKGRVPQRPCPRRGNHRRKRLGANVHVYHMRVQTVVVDGWRRRRALAMGVGVPVAARVPVRLRCRNELFGRVWRRELVEFSLKPVDGGLLIVSIVVVVSLNKVPIKCWRRRGRAHLRAIARRRGTAQGTFKTYRAAVVDSSGCHEKRAMAQDAVFLRD